MHKYKIMLSRHVILFRLSAKFIWEVNLQRDYNGLTFTRKALIILGLVLNTNGAWELLQVTPKLQGILARHMTAFEALRASVIDH